MNYHGKPLAFKITILLIIISTLNIILYSRIIANRGDEAFETPPYLYGNSETIQSCIIDGAGYYMRAYADILLFLQEIEWSEPGIVNYYKLKTLVNRAIYNMKNADRAYAALEELANTIPYNPVFIEKLTSFDYAAFQKVRAAEGTAFTNSVKYLAAGDVRGLFAYIKSGTGHVVNMLIDIKAAVDSGKFPELSSLWRLNQKSSEIMMTGQFAAEIFYEAFQDN